MRLTIISCVILACRVAVTPCFSQESGEPSLRERLRQRALEQPQTSDGSKSLLGGDGKSLGDPYNFHGGDTNSGLSSSGSRAADEVERRSGSRAFDLINGKSPSDDSSSLSETLRRMRESDERMKSLTVNPLLLPQQKTQPWWVTLKDKAISLVKSLLSLAGLLIMGFIGLVALFWIGYSGWSFKRSVDVRGGVKRNPQFQSEEKNSPK